jgi:hypothetical protein
VRREQRSGREILRRLRQGVVKPENISREDDIQMKKIFVAALVTIVCSLFASCAIGAAKKPEAKAAESSGVAAEYQILASTAGGLQGMSAPYALMLDARGKPLAGAESANHFIPAGMNMGDSLPLIRPDKAPGGAGNAFEAEQPDWTIKLYWGSSKTAQKGQPLVITPKEMKNPKGLSGKLADGFSGAWKGAPAAGWGWGEWPNKKTTVSVPAGASLLGDHNVTGSYLPDIKFKMDRDFLPPLEVTAGADANASIPVKWNAVNGAVGYFVYAMASDAAKKETVIWTSSAKPVMGGAGHEHSARVKELVKSGVALGPDALAVDIPAGIFAGADGVMILANAYGADYWAQYPPKPANAPANWKPEWTVNALFLSTWSGTPGGAAGGGASYGGVTLTDEQKKQIEEAQKQADEAEKETGIKINIPINIPLPKF